MAISEKNLKRHWAESKAKQVAQVIEDHHVHIAPWRDNGATISIYAIDCIKNAIAEGRAEVWNEACGAIEKCIERAKGIPHAEVLFKALLKDFVKAANEG